MRHPGRVQLITVTGSSGRAASETNLDLTGQAQLIELHIDRKARVRAQGEPALYHKVA
jgi:hypothetical protein